MKNLRHLLLAIALATAVSCGSVGPVTPSPNPDPGPVVNNTPPIVGTFSVQGSRKNEPPNFADVSEEVEVSVTVTDEDSTISDLKFNWSAAEGSFSGNGANVMWRAPAQAATPMEVTINVEVVETYTSQGRNVENKATGSTTLMLHDSLKEVGEMARQFLLDFSDSSKDVPQVMRNYHPDCYGTAAESRDVTINRQLFEIVNSNIGPANANVAFGGICPFRARKGDACSSIAVYWRSRFLKDNPESGNKVGDFTEAWGTDHITAMYYREQKRWKLCDSQFEGTHTLHVQGLVP